MTANTATDPGKHYVWHASDDFAIHLSIKAITQLQGHISRGANRGGNGELRGILLGRRVEQPFRATVVEDFQLVATDDDPTSNQEADEILLATARRAQENSELQVVGFFRSRRDGRLNMGPQDLETFSRLFGENGNVALLIQTSKRGNESDAALFYWDHAAAHPSDFGFGFPFDAGQLASGHPGWRYPNPIDDGPAAAATASAHAQTFAAPPPPPLPRISDFTMPPPLIPPAAGSGIHWGRLAPTVLLAALAIVTIQFLTNRGSAVTAASASTSTVASAAASPTPAPASENSGAGADLGLAVKALPHQLEIRWKRDSAAIAASERGEMKITEEGISESVPFDQAQLHDGYVSYTPKTSDVSIRLEVTGKDGATVSESVRTVAIP